MNRIRKAHPFFRQRVLLALLIVALAGVLIMVRIEKFEIELRYWILSEPKAFIFRSGALLFLTGALLSAPLLGFSCYLWRMGENIVQTREFPPAGYAVLKDTPVITGPKAIMRGRVVKLLGICLGLAAFFIGYLIWFMAKSLLLASG